MSFGRLSKFYINIEAAFYVSLYMFTYMSICPPIANIELNKEIEMHFKGYDRK